MVSHEGCITSQGGLSSGWSLIRVVSHQSGLSSVSFLMSGWSLIRVISHFRVVSHLRVISHHGGLTSERSLIRVLGGLS